MLNGFRSFSYAIAFSSGNPSEKNEIKKSLDIHVSWVDALWKNSIFRCNIDSILRFESVDPLEYQVKTLAHHIGQFSTSKSR